MNKTRILIVDDDVCVTEVLARVFERAGFEVAKAPNGEKALSLLSGAIFDIMICDICMPKMSGERLCNHLWTVGPYLPACTLIVTSRADEADRSWVTRMPGLTLVEKPVGPKHLLRIVREKLATAGEVDSKGAEEEAA